MEYRVLLLAAVDRLPDEPTVPEREAFTRVPPLAGFLVG